MRRERKREKKRGKKSAMSREEQREAARPTVGISRDVRFDGTSGKKSGCAKSELAVEERCCGRRKRERRGGTRKKERDLERILT